jgi:hypothetical protein
VRGIERQNVDILLDPGIREAIQPSILYPEGVITSKKMDNFRD